MDLAVNNLKWSVYHKNRPNQTVIAWLEFELVCYYVADQLVSNYVTVTPSRETIGDELEAWIIYHNELLVMYCTLWLCAKEWFIIQNIE